MQDPVRHRPVPYGPVMTRADGAVVPRWFELAVLSAAAFIAGFGLAALALAVVSAFSVVLVIAVGLNAGLLCVLGVLRLPERASPAKAGPSAIAAVAITVVVVVAMTTINGWAKAQHVLTDRDPGVYLVTGKWLAEQGQLPVEAAVGPFAQSDAVDPAPPVKSGGSPLGFFPSGYPDDPSATADLQPQFVHLYPSLLGTADWIGGNRLAQSLPALVGGVALLALFVLAARWMQPWAAAGATIAVAVSLPQAFFSRDTFSEVPVQLFLCAGVALAVRAFDGDDDRVGAAVVAGILLGASVATRVDALIALVAVPLWMSARWIERPRLVARRVLFLGVGAAVGIAVAVVDLLWRSRPYYELHRTEILSQVALFAAAIVAAVGAALLIPRWAWLRTHVTRWRRPVAWVSAVGTIAVGAFAWFVRPHIETTTETANGLVEFLQSAEGLAINALRRYYEHSMEWLSWYLGPVTLALGILGVAIAVWWVVLGRGRRSGLALALGVFLAPTVVYLWRARAVPDQMWVMRRFLPVTIPGSRDRVLRRARDHVAHSRRALPRDRGARRRLRCRRARDRAATGVARVDAEGDASGDRRAVRADRRGRRGRRAAGQRPRPGDDADHPVVVRCARGRRDRPLRRRRGEAARRAVASARAAARRGRHRSGARHRGRPCAGRRHPGDESP